MDVKELKKHITAVVRAYPEVKLVYLFGSAAREDTGPLSDVDVAVYLEGLGKREAGELRLKLASDLMKRLQTDKVDVTVLNVLDAPELKYQVITQGLLIYEEEPYRVLVEPRVLNEYFDFKLLLSRYGLTKA